MDTICNYNTQQECNSSQRENPVVIKISHWSRRLSEIPIFLYFLTYAFSETVYSNLIIYRTCTVTYGYNETLCTLLVSSKESNDTRHVEEIVQNYASKIIMARALITGIFPAIISLFLGPWSDRNGRKPLIIATMIGYFIYFCICVFIALWETLDSWWLLLSSLPYSLMGGLTSLITGCFCYISDITDESNRSYRMSVLECILLVGILIGSLLSPYAFNIFNYTIIFSISAGIMFIGLLYSFYLEETLPSHEFDRCSIFQKDLVTGMFKTCFKKRSHYRRAIIWLIMLSSSFAIFAQEGELTVLYLFVREKLSWELQQFSIYSVVSILTTVMGIGFVTFIMQKCFKCSDTYISMLAFISCGIKGTIVAFASKSWHMYLSIAVSSPRAAFGPTNRAILSKSVPQEDIGKVLSLTTSLETIIPLISGPLYSIVYQKTLTTFPGVYNLISVFLFVLSFIFVLVVDILKRRFPAVTYSSLTNSNGDLTSSHVH